MVDRGEVDGFVTASIDRVARSVGEIARFLENFSDLKGGPHLITDTICTMDHDPRVKTASTGRLVIHILAAMSQWERDLAQEPDE